MYHFFIDGVPLPVPPSKLSIKTKNKNRTVTLVNGTEYNLLKSPGLTEIGFECLLPNREYPFCVYENGFVPAADYLKLFDKLKTQCRVFTFCIERDGLSRSFFNCTLEDYTVTESTAEAFDITAGLKLKQYIPLNSAVIVGAADTAGTQVQQRQREITSQPEDIAYKIKSGDTLWGIAKRYYGDGSKWPELYAQNVQVIEDAAKNHRRASSSNGWWIYPDTVLSIKNGIKE